MRRTVSTPASRERITAPIVAAICLTALLPTPSGAQNWPEPAYASKRGAASPDRPVLADDATLANYLAYAARNNPGLEAAFDRWKAAIERVAQQKVLPDPRFTYGYFIEEVETRVGPQKQRFGLSQMFPWFGTLKLRGSVAAEAAHAAYEEFQAAKLQLFFDVKSAYYEYYYLHRAISITDDNMQLLKHLEGVARTKYTAGGSQTGVIRAQVELGKLEDRLRMLQDLRGPMMARLNAALNRPYDTSLPWPGQPPLGGAKIAEDEVFDQLVAANPEIRALDTLVRKEERATDLAQKAYYPNIILGVDYIDTDEALMPGTPDSGKDPVVAMLALDIPIWRGAYRAGVKEARLKRAAAERAREQKSNRLRTDLAMALFRFRDAERKIDLYGNALVPQAEQSMKVTEEAYRAGTDDFLNLIDAERLLLEFQLAHERALADREIAIAEIEKLVGKPLGTQATTQGNE